MLSIRFKLLGFHAVSIICTPVKTLNNYHFCKCRRRRPYEPNCNRRFVFRRPRARLVDSDAHLLRRIGFCDARPAPEAASCQGLNTGR